MRKYFGTDGIRGEVNSGKLTPELAMKVGMAAGLSFQRGKHRHRVVLGKDTRLSGYMIENAMVAGFCAAGMDVFLLGPIPTPAVAMLARSLESGPVRAAVVASRPADLKRSLDTLLEWLGGEIEQRLDIDRGIFLANAEQPPAIGYLFPGQGTAATLDGGLWAARFPFVRQRRNIALIGLSRVYLGVHFPSDVLAGWTAGALIVLWYAAITRRLGEPTVAAGDLSAGPAARDGAAAAADPAGPRSDPPARR